MAFIDGQILTAAQLNDLQPKQTLINTVQTFADLPLLAVGFYIVASDETKNGQRTLYALTPNTRDWIASIQEVI